jgi:precorrin-6B methylase 1
MTRDDHARLVALQGRLADYARKHPERVPAYLAENGFGLTVVIRELLRREDEHHARSTAYRQRSLKNP